MKSMPELDEEREYLDTIPGAVPLPHQMPRRLPVCPALRAGDADLPGSHAGAFAPNRRPQMPLLAVRRREA
jgi:hypothetical protein